MATITTISTETRDGTGKGTAAKGDDEPKTATTPKTTNNHQEEDDLFCPICLRCSASSTCCNREEEERQSRYDSSRVEQEPNTHGDDRTPAPREQELPLVSSSACPHAFCLECLERLFLVTSSNQQQQQQQQAAPSSSNQDDNHGLLLHIHCPICRSLWSYFDLVFQGNPQPPLRQREPVTAPSCIFPLPAQLQDCEFRSTVRRRQRAQAQPDKSPGYLWFPPAVVVQAAKNKDDDGGSAATASATTTTAPHPRWYFCSSTTTTAPASLEFIELTQHWYHDTFQTWQGQSEAMVSDGSTVRWQVIVSFAADWTFVRRGVVLQTTTTAEATARTNGTHPDPMKPPPPQKQIRVLGRMGGGRRELSYVRVARRTLPIPAPPPLYHHPNTLWGNVYCQAFTVGLASYHFVAAPGHPASWVGEDQAGEDAAANHDVVPPVAYFSYQHPDTAAWPSLDNGAPIPARVYFSNWSLVDHTTFRGTLAWQREHGTTWQGAVEWQYEMKFASDFSCIVGGAVYSVGVAEEATSPHRQLLSRYGEGLLYCNAGLWNTLVREYNINNYNNNNELGDIRLVIRQVEQQLIRQGATTAVVRMISSLHLAAWHGHPSPMEYV